MSDNRLLKATWIQASGTMVSRLLGAIRVILLAIVFGNGALPAETFSISLTVPNSIYVLIAGGTLTSVLVPHIVRASEKDADGGAAFINRFITIFLIALAILTVIFVILVPVIMGFYTDDVWRTPARASWWNSLLLMSYITMPQLFFWGVFFVLSQVLNARERFGPEKWAPAVNNIIAIAVLGSFAVIWGGNSANATGFTTEQAVWLALGSTIGIILQTLVLLPYLRKVGVRYRPRFDFRHHGLGSIFFDALWMFAYVGVIQLVQLLCVRLASSAIPINPATGLPERGAGWNVYLNANLIWLLPHSLVTVSVATAILPSSSRAAVREDDAAVASATGHASRLALTFLVPSTLAMLLLSNVIAQVGFGFGNGAADYQFVGWTLLTMAIGLIPYSLQYIFLRVFYAEKDYRTPFLIQLPISAVVAGLSLLLILPFGDPTTVAPRLALAMSLGYWVGLGITVLVLRRRLPQLRVGELARLTALLAFAAAPAVLMGWGVTSLLSLFASQWLAVLGLVVALVVTVVAFFLLAKLLRIPEATELINVVLRRKVDTETTEAVTSGELTDSATALTTPVFDQDDSAWTGTIDLDNWQEGTADVEVNPTQQLLADPDGKGIFIRITWPSDPLDFAIEEPTGPIVPVTESAGPQQLLADRFLMQAKLSQHGEMELWRAFDEVLGRNVLVYLLSASAAGTASILAAARRAAGATDARFLRVLDVESGHPDAATAVPPYVVYEYVPGITLAKVLADGLLAGNDIAWLVREVADALAHLHEAGMAHGRITPATVLLTTAGAVKITGLLAAQGGKTATRAQAADDVRALGRLLYAGLFGTWIGGPVGDLPAAELVDGRLAAPEAMATVADASILNIIERILEPEQGSATRITTATEVATALSALFGTGSASASLRRRLTPDDSSLISTIDPPTPPASPASPATDPSLSPPSPTGDPSLSPPSPTDRSPLSRHPRAAGSGIQSDHAGGIWEDSEGASEASTTTPEEDQTDTDALSDVFASNAALFEPTPPPNRLRATLVIASVAAAFGAIIYFLT
ncbi:MAG: murein biosynthesis integral membrane protein MurJ [Propionibacteriaceae bacterium]|jgi:murein biosynthesis integral membrane protein MurJ|nr:murein biosynthesis integral membrane protein MurJ [Propionibacteriaceae bacterium]